MGFDWLWVCLQNLCAGDDSTAAPPQATSTRARNLSQHVHSGVPQKETHVVPADPTDPNDLTEPLTPATNNSDHLGFASEDDSKHISTVRSGNWDDAYNVIQQQNESIASSLPQNNEQHLMMFKIKKFSQQSLGIETTFEPSFQPIYIPTALNDDDEEDDEDEKEEKGRLQSPITPHYLSPMTPKTTDSDASAYTYDQNILQLKEVIWSVTNPEFIGKDGIELRDVILLCHPIFTESIAILQLLQKRFLKKDKDTDDELHFKIQTKVTDFIQKWMRQYYYQDFELCPDDAMNITIHQFIDTMQKYHEKRKGDMLPTMMEKTINSQTSKLKKLGLDKASRKIAKAEKLLGFMDQQHSLTFIDKKIQKINDKKFLYADNPNIAQQVTVLQFEHFRAIEARECLCQNWKKKDKELRAPNICKSVKFFNNLSNYVAMSILREKEAKQRSRIIRKWIKIGAELFDLHNFESLAAVQGALTSTSIYRLKKEWKNVPEKHMNKFKEITALYASGKNNANLRQIIQITPPPMIPYTGLFLRDLFMIEESQRTTKKDGTINFPKLMQLHVAIKRIQILQHTQYDVKENDNIQQFIKEGLMRYAHLTSDDIYHASVAASGKGKKV